MTPFGVQVSTTGRGRGGVLFSSLPLPFDSVRQVVATELFGWERFPAGKLTWEEVSQGLNPGRELNLRYDLRMESCSRRFPLCSTPACFCLNAPPGSTLLVCWMWDLSAFLVELFLALLPRPQFRCACRQDALSLAFFRSVCTSESHEEFVT